MAIKPTIYKANVNIVDMNRDVYASERLTLALHPSETTTRLMVRVLAYALNYHEQLSFTKGLSTADEPDLWRVNDNGVIEQWIELGQASVERLRKGVSRSETVVLYAYGSEADLWWNKHAKELRKLPKTTIYCFDAEPLATLAELCNRNMELTVTLSESQIYVSMEGEQVDIQLETLL